jgi:uncharacterized membrane protein SpoIIM required for sporulation
MPTAYPEWKRLEELLDVVRTDGFAPLHAEEIIEFGKLYRRAAAELAFFRTHEADAARLTYLNDLLGRCYPFVYAAPRRPWPSVVRFFTHEFPRAVRRHVLWVVLALLISLVPALITFGLTMHDRTIAYQVLPRQFMEMIDHLVERHKVAQDWTSPEERPSMATGIIANNITVTISVFAGGMTFGLLTVFMLITNGMMLGVATAASCHSLATAVDLWGFIAPHGVFELTAIFIAGAGGLMLAYAMLNPGALPRRVALRDAGTATLPLIIGVVCMLVVAGLIEGLFSPLKIATQIKFTVALVEGALLLAYILFAGRRHTRETPEQPYGALITPLPPV